MNPGVRQRFLTALIVASVGSSLGAWAAWIGYSPSDRVYPMPLSRVVRLFLVCFVWPFSIVWWAAKPSAGER
jgi:hypothetical protein